jgi:hypothetical protein
MDLRALKELISNIERLSGSRQLILFGSSSLFASFHSEAPENIGVETTLDADFFLDPDDDECRAILVSEFGREHDYHLAHGFYADFVDLRLADAFPQGWRDRLVPMPGFTNVVALHPMDMAVSKVNATARSRLDRRFGRRETDRGLKDINTLVTLIRAGYLDADELSRQVFLLEREPACIAEYTRVIEEIQQRVAKS